MSTFADVVSDALEGLGKTDAALRVVDPAARQVVKEMTSFMRSGGTEDPEDFFTDDPEANRAVMAGVALANEINSEVDWSSVPADVLSIAWTALKTAAALSAIL